MNWFLKLFGSSIGKKLMMAVTGLCFCLFLAGHLAGNLTIYGGSDLFNAYAENLHALGPLLTVVEIFLLFMAVVHVLTGSFLFYGNVRARPQRYVKKKRAGGRTIGSATMPYTGFFMLFFVILHLLNFTFIDKAGQTSFQIVSNTFSNPLYVMFYMFAMAVVGVHISHGLWSAFQSIGANHPKYMPVISVVSVIFSLIIGAGFGVLPIYITLIV
jgi:succinate dehydrogenase / fumarate reductase cytochrome b subunit